MVSPLSHDGSAEATTSRGAVVTASPLEPASSSSLALSSTHASAPADPPLFSVGNPGPSSSSGAGGGYGGGDGHYRAAADGSPRRGRFHVPDGLHSMVAGAGAGLVSSIATCPLDVVKTTLQAQSIPKDQPGYEGVTKTCMRIYRLSGVRGFYRGLGPTIAGYLPTWGIYFTVYDFIKDRMARGLAASGRPEKYPSLIHVTAAMTAGATGTILTNPLWVVKTRFMAQAVLPPDAPRYRTTWDAIKTIYRTEGLSAFYKGLIPSLFGVTHVAVQFGLYEKTKTAMAHDGQPLTPTSILAASAFSKMIASLATYPHEVLRTRMQVRRAVRPPPPPPPYVGHPARATPGPATLYSPLVTGSTPPLVHSMGDAADGPQSLRKTGWSPKKGGIVDTFRKIYRQDGWQGFYRGLSINLVRTVPSSAVTMLTYELIMRNLS